MAGFADADGTNDPVPGVVNETLEYCPIVPAPAEKAGRVSAMICVSNVNERTCVFHGFDVTSWDIGDDLEPFFGHYWDAGMG